MPMEAEPVTVLEGDCREVLRDYPDGCFDSVVSDPPYGIGFMGKEWDKPGSFVERKPAKRNRFDHVGGNHNPSNGYDAARTRRVEGQRFGAWCGEWLPEVLRVLRPGGYLLAMGGTRTFHRLTCAIEDSGFEIRDCLSWLYGSGFPKGKGCLKPAWEPIILARKPGARVLPLGVDECRVGHDEPEKRTTRTVGKFAGVTYAKDAYSVSMSGGTLASASPSGRWPANVVHDGGEEVLEAFGRFGERKAGGVVNGTEPSETGQNGIYGRFRRVANQPHADTGTAARFFYAAKASRSERGEGNSHPTVKPLSLMRWLVRLVTPVGGVVLDPFGGSGTTGKAAILEGRPAVLIKRDPAYAALARKRIAAATESLFAGARP